MVCGLETCEIVVRWTFEVIGMYVGDFLRCVTVKKERAAGLWQVRSVISVRMKGRREGSKAPLVQI